MLNSWIIRLTESIEAFRNWSKNQPFARSERLCTLFTAGSNWRQICPNRDFEQEIAREAVKAGDEVAGREAAEARMQAAVGEDMAAGLNPARAPAVPAFAHNAGIKNRTRPACAVSIPFARSVGQR